MDLAIYDQTQKGVSTEHIELVTSVLNYAGDFLKLPETTEMSVTFVNNDEIQRINREYRHLDKATDVISFALEDEDDDLPIVFDDEMAADLAKNIGDIFVSVDKVQEQADFLEHSFERELGFLVVHGFLHLNNYDHMRGEAEEKEMFGLQREILDGYGLTR
ncbi:rRNA maturation RNase YbeY [Weissella diestrammenae]|uniref:Endoribonuclease YbeY n=1 Tax=Weissella diestrammenae TaxID=1162633 RepID=A0A7G9T7G6_9LACO|nr:rRNA maturation RNase YbeY [Weissella diestrammenae]MCM0582335.1 rRNA maturation RNase YbeY [Weissella diestrammenae]QNN76041.1 rRNA maturation RNase YbeY [Weissella diestrammenae]